MKSLEYVLRNWPRSSLSDLELEILLDGSRDSRYGKVKRWLSQGKLIHLRRGLYLLTEAVGYQKKPHPFELAQYIYAPSYISLESALAYHQLIPEAVYTTTSVCTKRAKEFHTPLGIFSYLHLPEENFYAEVELVNENNNRFFIAKPWKAICDYIYCYKKNWKNIDPLLKSLRIEKDDLPSLSDQEVEILEDFYQHSRLSRFLNNIRKDIPNER